jgi:hypothetical protein
MAGYFFVYTLINKAVFFLIIGRAIYINETLLASHSCTPE